MNKLKAFFKEAAHGRNLADELIAERKNQTMNEEIDTMNELSELDIKAIEFIQYLEDDYSSEKKDELNKFFKEFYGMEGRR